MIAPGTNIRPGQPLAVVVGAGGMGLAVARRLGQTHRVMLADANAEHLEGVVKRLRSEGLDPVGLACDVTRPDMVEALARSAQEAGPVRALAHVVGLSPSMADWSGIMRVNLIGAALVERAFRPIVEAGGAAVFVASLAAHMTTPPAEVLAILDRPLDPGFETAIDSLVAEQRSSVLAYQYSKFALVRMCQQRAAEWGSRGVRIVSLSPGLTATPMGALEFERQPMKYKLLEDTPLQREGTMVEIADAVEFLVSSKASFISGTDLLVDGGLRAATLHRSDSPAG